MRFVFFKCFWHFDIFSNSITVLSKRVTCILWVTAATASDRTWSHVHRVHIRPWRGHWEQNEVFNHDGCSSDVEVLARGGLHLDICSVQCWENLNTSSTATETDFACWKSNFVTKTCDGRCVYKTPNWFPQSRTENVSSLNQTWGEWVWIEISLLTYDIFNKIY